MAIFGKDNSDLLHQVLREIGELRQQMAGQQHAVDQTRQDANAAIGTGLTEIRSVVRDGLARGNDTIANPLAQINTELVSVRAALRDLARGAVQPQADQTQAANGESDGSDERQPDEEALELLEAAAGISAATLWMHRDTWGFLVEHAAGDRHFHLPGAVREDDGGVDVSVSGPSVVAVLTSLDRVRRTATDLGTRAIAQHLHQRFSDTVKEIVKNPHRDDGSEPVSIVIDDRAEPPGEDQ